MSNQKSNQLINLHDRGAVLTRRPLLIAHRGGVITPDSPENSSKAIQLAAAEGFDLVELDVRAAKDGEPVIFHGYADHLAIDCGIDAKVSDLTATELTAIRYRGTDQTILTLEQALAHCVGLSLGIMLDFKDVNDESSPDFVGGVNQLVQDYELTHATMTISRHPLVREYLADQVLRALTGSEAARVLDGEERPFTNCFWFAHPEDLPAAQVKPMQDQGVLVIPAVNTFRYPKHSFSRLEKEDIQSLVSAGVDGVQIDSIYRQCFV